MNQCKWETVDSFSSLGEYQRFCRWLDEQVLEGLVKEVPVEDSYAGSLFDEKWFQCNACGEKWRLVAPQDPFHGFWGFVR
jgi:hypothetical protein